MIVGKSKYNLGINSRTTFVSSYPVSGLAELFVVRVSGWGRDSIQELDDNAETVSSALQPEKMFCTSS